MGNGAEPKKPQTPRQLRVELVESQGTGSSLIPESVCTSHVGALFVPVLIREGQLPHSFSDSPAPQHHNGFGDCWVTLHGITGTHGYVIASVAALPKTTVVLVICKARLQTWFLHPKPYYYPEGTFLGEDILKGRHR